MSKGSDDEESNREKLREAFLNPDQDKVEVEVLDFTLLIEPISHLDAERMVSDINDPEKNDMRVVMSVIVNHVYDENEEPFLDQDDVEDLLERPHNDPYVSELVEKFNEVNDFELDLG